MSLTLTAGEAANLQEIRRVKKTHQTLLFVSIEKYEGRHALPTTERKEGWEKEME